MATAYPLLTGPSNVHSLGPAPLSASRSLLSLHLGCHMLLVDYTVLGYVAPESALTA